MKGAVQKKLRKSPFFSKLPPFRGENRGKTPVLTGQRREKSRGFRKSDRFLPGRGPKCGELKKYPALPAAWERSAGIPVSFRDETRKIRRRRSQHPGRPPRTRQRPHRRRADEDMSDRRHPPRQASCRSGSCGPHPKRRRRR